MISQLLAQIHTREDEDKSYGKAVQGCWGRCKWTGLGKKLIQTLETPQQFHF